MRRTATTHQRTVKVLKNANPSFVSLVRAGANGTPLNVVKSDEPVQQETDMSKKSPTDIHHLVFAGSRYKAEADVLAWLEAGGYKDCVVVAKGDGFEVAGNESVPDPVEIDLGDDVTAFVGVAPEEAVAAKGEVTALEGQKTEEPTTGAQKDDGTVQHVATDGGTEANKDAATADATGDTDTGATDADDETTPAKGKKAPKGKTPAAKDEVAPPPAELPVLLVKDDKGVVRFGLVAKKGIYSISDLADVLAALTWIKQDADYGVFSGGTDDKLAGALRENIKAIGETLIMMAQDAIANAAKSDEPAVQVPGEEPVKAAGEAPVKSDASKQESSTDGQSALLAAIGALTDTVKGLDGRVAELASKSEQNTEQASKLAERLEKVESTSQSRKSAAVEDGVPSKPKGEVAKKSDAEISKEVQDRNALALMGM